MSSAGSTRRTARASSTRAATTSAAGAPTDRRRAAHEHAPPRTCRRPDWRARPGRRCRRRTSFLPAARAPLRCRVTRSSIPSGSPVAARRSTSPPGVTQRWIVSRVHVSQAAALDIEDGEHHRDEPPRRCEADQVPVHRCHRGPQRRLVRVREVQQGLQAGGEERRGRALARYVGDCEEPAPFVERHGVVEIPANLAERRVVGGQLEPGARAGSSVGSRRAWICRAAIWSASTSTRRSTSRRTRTWTTASATVQTPAMTNGARRHPDGRYDHASRPSAPKIVDTTATIVVHTARACGESWRCQVGSQPVAANSSVSRWRVIRVAFAAYQAERMGILPETAQTSSIQMTPASGMPEIA